MNASPSGQDCHEQSTVDSNAIDDIQSNTTCGTVINCGKGENSSTLATHTEVQANAPQNDEAFRGKSLPVVNMAPVEGTAIDATTALASTTLHNDTNTHEEHEINNPLVTSDSSISCCGAVSDSEISAVINKAENANNNVAASGNSSMNSVVVDEDCPASSSVNNNHVRQFRNQMNTVSPPKASHELHHQKQQPLATTTVTTNIDGNTTTSSSGVNYATNHVYSNGVQHINPQQAQQVHVSTVNNHQGHQQVQHHQPQVVHNHVQVAAPATATPVATNSVIQNPNQTSATTNHTIASNKFPQQQHNPTPAQPEPTKKTKNMHDLHSKFMHELQYMMYEFRKLERQLLSGQSTANSLNNMPETQGSRERREKLRSFILHLEDTMLQITNGCKKEELQQQQGAYSSSNIDTSNPLKEAQLKEEELMEKQTIQRLEEHILTNLLPVKERLIKQLTAQGKSTSRLNDSLNNSSSLKRQRASSFYQQQQQSLSQQHCFRSMAGTPTINPPQHQQVAQQQSMVTNGEDKSMIVQKFKVGQGSSLTRKLHGTALGVNNTTNVPCPFPDKQDNDGKRTILYGGVAPGADRSSVSTSCNVASSAAAPVVTTPASYASPVQQQRPPPPPQPQQQVQPQVQVQQPISTTTTTPLPNNTASTQANVGSNNAAVMVTNNAIPNTLQQPTQQQPIQVIVKPEVQQTATVTTTAPALSTATPAVTQPVRQHPTVTNVQPQPKVIQQQPQPQQPRVPIQPQQPPITNPPTTAIQQTNIVNTNQLQIQPQHVNNNTPLSQATIQQQSQPATAALQAALNETNETINANTSKLSAVIFKETIPTTNDLVQPTKPMLSAKHLSEDQKRMLRKKRRKKRRMLKRKRRRLQCGNMSRTYNDQVIHTHSSSIPRPVEYTCALCNETYGSSCDYNPWWALTQEDCRRCSKLQVPRIDISAPANAIDYHPALLAHADDGGGTVTNETEEMEQQQQIVIQQQYTYTQQVQYEDMDESNTIIDDYNDLSSHGTISDGSDNEFDDEEEDDDDDEFVERSSIEYGSTYDGPKLSNDEAAKLLTLIQHASICPGRHKNQQLQQICNSTKYLMLHVRDCAGIVPSTGEVCPYPWCTKVKHLLYHLLSCTEKEGCSICSLKNNLQGNFTSLNIVNDRLIEERKRRVIAYSALGGEGQEQVQQHPQHAAVAPQPGVAQPASYTANGNTAPPAPTTYQSNATTQATVNITYNQAAPNTNANHPVTVNPLQTNTLAVETSDVQKVQRCFPDVKLENSAAQSSATATRQPITYQVPTQQVSQAQQNIVTAPNTQQQPVAQTQQVALTNNPLSDTGSYTQPIVATATINQQQTVIQPAPGTQNINNPLATAQNNTTVSPSQSIPVSESIHNPLSATAQNTNPTATASTSQNVPFTTTTVYHSVPAAQTINNPAPPVHQNINNPLATAQTISHSTVSSVPVAQNNLIVRQQQPTMQSQPAPVAQTTTQNIHSTSVASQSNPTAQNSNMSTVTIQQQQQNINNSLLATTQNMPPADATSAPIAQNINNPLNQNMTATYSQSVTVGQNVNQQQQDIQPQPAPVAHNINNPLATSQTISAISTTQSVPVQHMNPTLNKQPAVVAQNATIPHSTLTQNTHQVSYQSVPTQSATVHPIHQNAPVAPQTNFVAYNQTVHQQQFQVQAVPVAQTVNNPLSTQSIPSTAATYSQTISVTQTANPTATIHQHQPIQPRSVPLVQNTNPHVVATQNTPHSQPGHLQYINYSTGTILQPQAGPPIHNVNDPLAQNVSIAASPQIVAQNNNPIANQQQSMMQSQPTPVGQINNPLATTQKTPSSLSSQSTLVIQNIQNTTIHQNQPMLQSQEHTVAHTINNPHSSPSQSIPSSVTTQNAPPNPVAYSQSVPLAQNTIHPTTPGNQQQPIVQYYVPVTHNINNTPSTGLHTPSAVSAYSQSVTTAQNVNVNNPLTAQSTPNAVPSCSQAVAVGQNINNPLTGQNAPYTVAISQSVPVNINNTTTMTNQQQPIVQYQSAPIAQNVNIAHSTSTHQTSSTTAVSTLPQQGNTCLPPKVKGEDGVTHNGHVYTANGVRHAASNQNVASYTIIGQTVANSSTSVATAQSALTAIVNHQAVNTIVACQTQSPTAGVRQPQSAPAADLNQTQAVGVTVTNHTQSTPTLVASQNQSAPISAGNHLQAGATVGRSQAQAIMTTAGKQPKYATTPSTHSHIKTEALAQPYTPVLNTHSAAPNVKIEMIERPAPVTNFVQNAQQSMVQDNQQIFPDVANEQHMVPNSTVAGSSTALKSEPCTEQDNNKAQSIVAENTQVVLGATVQCNTSAHNDTAILNNTSTGSQVLSQTSTLNSTVTNDNAVNVPKMNHYSATSIPDLNIVANNSVVVGVHPNSISNACTSLPIHSQPSSTTASVAFSGSGAATPIQQSAQTEVKDTTIGEHVIQSSSVASAHTSPTAFPDKVSSSPENPGNQATETEATLVKDLSTQTTPLTIQETSN